MMLSLVLLLVFAGGSIPFLVRAAALRTPAKTEWSYFEEIALMLLFPLAGELLGSFFLTRKPLVLLVGILMALLACGGAIIRFHSRQQENPDDDAKKDKQNLHARHYLAIGTAVLWAGVLLNQYQNDWLPAFRMPQSIFHHNP